MEEENTIVIAMDGSKNSKHALKSKYIHSVIFMACFVCIIPPPQTTNTYIPIYTTYVLLIDLVCVFNYEFKFINVEVKNMLGKSKL